MANCVAHIQDGHQIHVFEGTENPTKVTYDTQIEAWDITQEKDPFWKDMLQCFNDGSSPDWSKDPFPFGNPRNFSPLPHPDPTWKNQFAFQVTNGETQFFLGGWQIGDEDSGGNAPLWDPSGKLALELFGGSYDAQIPHDFHILFNSDATCFYGWATFSDLSVSPPLPKFVKFYGKSTRLKPKSNLVGMIYFVLNQNYIGNYTCYAPKFFLKVTFELLNSFLHRFLPLNLVWLIIP
jgi:hypothetical protein